MLHVRSFRLLLWTEAYSSGLDHKEGKPGPLKFPPFHPEMLSQAWVLPGQSMGRIKVVIAEGISRGKPGTTPFEKTRNLVAFSFQHTPLCESEIVKGLGNTANAPMLDILEESGIAWPNPGMFYQIQHEDLNPLSPRKDKYPDPDSHAHSPRHRAPMTATNDPVKLNGMIPPPAFPYGTVQHGMMMPRPPFRASGFQLGDAFIPQYGHHDPFSNIGEHMYRRRLLQDYTRQSSSSGDVSMQDALAKSRSTISDQAMLDYTRPHSPISSYKSFQMSDYSRPFSPESRRSFSLHVPPGLRPQSPGETRKISTESLRGPSMQRLFSEMAAQDDSETLVEEPSQFTEMVDAMSPPKILESGCYPPANTRVSSTTNTPPPAARASAAAEARAVSYSGKNRSVSNTTRDLPPPTYSRTSSDVLPKARTTSRKSDSRRSEIGDGVISNLQKLVNKAPSTIIRSRKENRTIETGNEDVVKPRGKTSSGTNLIHDKENLEIVHSASADNKRRRVSSNNVSPGTPLGPQRTLLDTPSKIIFNDDGHTISSDKINEIDDLTADGVVVRTPLGDMGNMI